MIFYERLKMLMDEKKITAKQLSKELHINKNSFTYWKKNGNIPKGNSLQALADYFNCSIDFLLGKTDEKTKQVIQNEQPVSDNLKLLIQASSNLSDEEILKTREYVEFLKSQRK